MARWFAAAAEFGSALSRFIFIHSDRRIRSADSFVKFGQVRDQLRGAIGCLDAILQRFDGILVAAGGDSVVGRLR